MDNPLAKFAPFLVGEFPKPFMELLKNVSLTPQLNEDDLKKELETKQYEYGFYTDIDSETFPVGLNEDIVRAISKKKNEPKWMTDWRLDAFSTWKAMKEPEWSNLKYNKPNFQQDVKNILQQLKKTR